jgi:hypothetical protein
VRTKLIRTTLPVILERGGEEFSAIDSESDTKIKWRVLNVVTPSITAQKQSNAATTWQLALLARWRGVEHPCLIRAGQHHRGGEVRCLKRQLM